MERKKLFGGVQRRKLFSETSVARKKLFSSSETINEGGIVLRELICKDCGHVITTAEHPSHAVCPNCGGKRLDIKLFPEPHEEVKLDKEVHEPEPVKDAVKQFSERKSLFADYLTPFQESLKSFSGKSLEKDEFDKTFSEHADEMFEKSYASVLEDGSVSISDSAFATERLFSKLIISVTKTLELDPSVMNGEFSKEEIIDKLEDKIPEKGIMILKKTHGIPVMEHEEHHFSDISTWVEDSSIIPDLELEYNNTSFGIEQFIKILRERYPDAPEDIMDILQDRGVIRLEGTQVTVQSNSKK